MFNRNKNDKISNVAMGKLYVSALTNNFKTRLRIFRENRSSDAQKALIDDFDQVLHAWGIGSKVDIPFIIRELRMRCLIFMVSIFIIIILAVFLQNLFAYLSLVCVALPCFLGLITTLWRISILKHRNFVPLSRWLFAPLFVR